MKPNKVAPWEGELVWIDSPRTGTSKKGNHWSSVDFVLKYYDEQNNERHILFNVFGDEKVNSLFACQMGTKLRVDWTPSARENNGKWWGKLEAFEITVLQEPAKNSNGTELPDNAPEYQPQHADEPDLPF